MTDRKPETRLIHSLMGLVGAVRTLGVDAARDHITAHCDLGDGGDDPFETHLIDQISHAVQRAGDIVHEGATRCITVEDAARGQAAHFSWTDDGKALSEAYRAAIHNAVRLAIGPAPARLSLPIDPATPRQWSADEHSGECFATDRDYDGWILQVELRDEAEANDIAMHMDMMWPKETLP